MKRSALLSCGEKRQKSLCATNPFALLKIRLSFLKNAPVAKHSRSGPARGLLPQLPVFVAMVAALLWAPLSFSFVMGPTPNFDWSMPERFGLDQDGDDIIDIPNTAVYGQPSGFSVNFDASLSVPGASPIVSYIWTIAGGRLTQPITLTGPAPSAHNLKEGVYSVTLTVTDGDGLSDSITRTVVVKDILIVAIGDSYASGEGNPDIPQAFDSLGFVRSGARWTDSVQDASLWGDNRIHSRCHRSAWAGSAQAALSLERSDPHTSVTFVFAACSGARLSEAVIGNSYRGIESPDDPNNLLPSQIDQVAGIVGTRQIDALIISIGGNDAGFSNIVKALVMLGPLGQFIPLPDLNFLNWDQAIGPIIATLPNLYSSLNAEIESKLNVSNIYITEYPDPTHDGAGQTCTAMLTDVLFPNIFSSPGIPTGITSFEADWARSDVIGPLNQAVETAAIAQGWNFVSGISADFLTHGYCAAGRAANVPEERWRWIVTAEESVIHQGPVFNLLTISALEKGQTDGTLHPNFLGHRSYRDRLLAHLNQLDFVPPEITCPGDLTVPADAGGCQAVVTYATVATDNRAGVQTSCTPFPGSTFQKGSTTVVCTATDTSSNAATCSFTVTVVDQEAPAIVCPPTQVAAATSATGAVVNYTAPSATDNCSGATVVCSPASGSTFQIGTTAVNCVATDSSNNQSSCSFAVKVKGAAEQASDLIALVESFGLQSGIETSLLAKLQAALTAINSSDYQTACARLEDFISEVNAQAGKRYVATDQANQMIAAAERIKSVLGCAQ